MTSARVLSDLCTCFEKALDRSRVVKSTSEQRYALCAARPSSIEFASQCGVGISTVVLRNSRSAMCPLALQTATSLDQAQIVLLQEKQETGHMEPSKTAATILGR